MSYVKIYTMVALLAYFIFRAIYVSIVFDCHDIINHVGGKVAMTRRTCGPPFFPSKPSIIPQPPPFLKVELSF